MPPDIVRYSEKLEHASISSRLDYCNALFAAVKVVVKLTPTLVMNVAARVFSKNQKV